MLLKYSGNDIFIFGSGASLDLIDSETFNNKFKIGLNNVDHKYVMNVSILNSNWFTNSLNSEGHNSKIYITKKEISNNAIDQLICRESSNPTINQEIIGLEEILIADPLFLTALNLCLKISSIRNAPQNVYFLGFDFDFDEGFSRGLEVNFAGDGPEIKQLKINSQKQVFKQVQREKRFESLIITHVGVQEFSNLTPTAFNIKHKKLTIQQADIFFNRSPVEITAEITTNHLGQISRAEEMVIRAKKNGANLVKFQMRNVDTFYSRAELSSPYISPFGNTYGDYRHALEFSDSEFQQINEICTKLDIKWFVSVLDEFSYKRAIKVGSKMIKLPSTISEKKSYLLNVAESYKGEIVISTGMTDESYAKWILETFKIQEKIYLLHTNSSYPTPIEDCNILVLNKYREFAAQNKRIIPGYSSHDRGSFGSILAVACGARMIEKHVKLGSTDWLHFDEVAVDLLDESFYEFVSDIRKAEIALGSDAKQITRSEHHKY